MFKKASKPKDHYSADWAVYWAQNPGLHRGVGAEAVDPPADPPANPPAIDPAQFAALQEELERFKAKHKEAEKHLKEKERLAKEAAEEAARKSGDVEALEKSWREKLEAETKDLREQLAAKDKENESLTVGMVIKDIEKDVFITSKVDHGLKSRLVREVVDGETMVRVLDKEGKPSAMTVEQLKEEYRADPEFAPFVIGSKANGSGGVGGKGVSGNGDVMKLSPVERMNAGRNAKA